MQKVQIIPLHKDGEMEYEVDGIGHFTQCCVTPYNFSNEACLWYMDITAGVWVRVARVVGLSHPGTFTGLSVP